MSSTLNSFSVRRVRHSEGTVSYWIFGPDGQVHRPSLDVLKHHRTSTQQTYAYSLVDHLNWAHANDRQPESVTFKDLQNYMFAATGQLRGVAGAVWQSSNRAPISASTAANYATVIRAYYVQILSRQGINPQLLSDLEGEPVFGRRRQGARPRAYSPNPLSPKRSSGRPRFLPDAVVAALFEPGVLTSARDVMIVTWLHDSGIRVGGLCGLRMSDLHLVTNHPCGQRQEPHIHIVPRDDNPNQARAKHYGGESTFMSPEGVVIDGVIRAVSPDMVSTYFAYLLDDYHSVQAFTDHDQVLVHIGGRSPGTALTTSGVRKMLRRSSNRAEINSRVTPHAFRHKAASGLYAATDFNADIVAQEFGWSSPAMVTELYGVSANRDTIKHLRLAWEKSARPVSDRALSPHLDTLYPGVK